MKGATDSDRRESSVSYRMEPKHTRDRASRTTRQPRCAWHPRQNHPNPSETTPDPVFDNGGDTEWVECSRGSLVVRVTRDARDLYASPLIRRRVPCFHAIGQSMLHPDTSGMKHGTPQTHENHVEFV